MQEKPSLTIYFDGTCNLCSAAVTRIDESSKGERFNSRAVSENQLPQGVGYKAAMRDVHVVDEKGQLYKGIDAVLRILDEYPHWRFLVRIGRLPLFKQMLAFLYRLIELTRYQIFGRK